MNLAVVVIDLANEFLFLENPAHLPLDFPDTDLGVIMVHEAGHFHSIHSFSLFD